MARASEGFMSTEMVLDHRETHLNMMAHDRNVWEVFTDDPVWINRIEKLGIRPTAKAVDGFTYQLRSDQVLIRKGKRVVSDEQRRKAAEHMKLLRERMTVENPGSEPERKR